MAEKRRLLSCAALTFSCAGLVLSCSSGKTPKPLPSQTLSQVAPQLAAPPPVPPPIRAIRPTPSSVKVIDSGGDDSRPKTLAEASRLAKAQKGKAGESVAIINDDNLHEYAQGAEVIVLESEPAAPEPELDPLPAADESPEIRDEQYWRSRALELRMGWRRTIDRITELELESAALRQQFYAEDDPYLRDSQLKPAWDRVLDRLEQLRDQSTQYQQELDVFIAEGQRTSTPQGWLNQGWELEPSPEEKRNIEKIGATQSVDPPSGNTAVDPEVYDP